MNKIRINRLLLAGFVTLVMFIVAELFVEQIIARMVLGFHLAYQETNVQNWGIANHVLNILIALLNSTLLIWLYASLRPMFGVGYKTALIASGISIILGLSMTINGINLGLFPARLALLEMVFEAIELPLAMVTGALVYEGVTEPMPA